MHMLSFQEIDKSNINYYDGKKKKAHRILELSSMDF